MGAHDVVFHSVHEHVSHGLERAEQQQAACVGELVAENDRQDYGKDADIGHPEQSSDVGIAGLVAPDAVPQRIRVAERESKDTEAEATEEDKSSSRSPQEQQV